MLEQDSWTDLEEDSQFDMHLLLHFLAQAADVGVGCLVFADSDSHEALADFVQAAAAYSVQVDFALVMLVASRVAIFPVAYSDSVVDDLFALVACYVAAHWKMVYYHLGAADDFAVVLHLVVEEEKI